jgi:hypothetical protein
LALAEISAGQEDAFLSGNSALGLSSRKHSVAELSAASYRTQTGTCH